MPSPAIHPCRSYECSLSPSGATATHETHYTWNTSSAVFLMIKDRGSEVLYTLHRKPIRQISKHWHANLSVTLTGDQSPKAPFLAASPPRGRPEHSQDCRTSFTATGCGMGTSYTPSDGDEHPYHCLVSTACAPSQSKKYSFRRPTHHGEDRWKPEICQGGFS